MEKRSRRHGDVALIAIKETSELRELFDAAKKNKELTLALGEATGHHHTMYPVKKDGWVKSIEVKGQRFIEVGVDYFLRHQEHKEHQISPGIYRVPMEDEYDPFEKAMRKVID